MRMLKWMVPAMILALGLAACGTDDSGGSGGGDSGSVTFALTDAPSDELSVLQVELTDVSITNTAGVPTAVFPTSAGGTLVVNLLRLRGIHQLLGNVALPPGSYEKIELSYINATAVDTQGNTLTVNPDTAGTVTVVLQPALVVGSANLLFEIDFDVNTSVSNLVTGVGGSLTMNPVLIARVDDTPTGGQRVEDFKGIVQAVSPMAMKVGLGSGTVLVQLTATTTVQAGGSFLSAGSVGFDLSTLVSIGNIVEVDGAFNAAAGTVVATFVELEDSISGLDGPEAQGMVVAVGAGSFDLLVTESRDSSINAGSVQAIEFDGSTFFKWSDPDAAATSANLRLGMEVRVTLSGSAALAVKLRATKLRGSVLSVDSVLGQAQITVSALEGVAISQFAGFGNPVTVQFSGAIPAGVSVGAQVELEGHFDRTTNGVFDVRAGAGQGEDNHTHSLEGYVFSVIGTAPLAITLTGQLESATGVVNVTATVLLAPQVVIIEQNDDLKTSTTITAAELQAGIASGRFVELKAEGPYDAGSTTLTATKIVAEMN